MNQIKKLANLIRELYGRIIPWHSRKPIMSDRVVKELTRLLNLDESLREKTDGQYTLQQ